MRRALAGLLFATSLVLGCPPRGEPSGGSADISSSTKPFPSAAEQVDTLRDAGVVWSNAEIRGFYVKQVAAIGPANEKWKKEGVSAEERARRCFTMRHDARVMARSMMKDPADIDALRERDMAKYGRPDGPAFYELVNKSQQRGLTGDAVFEAIVESAQKTDAALNDLMGVK